MRAIPLNKSGWMSPGLVGRKVAGDSWIYRDGDQPDGPERACHVLYTRPCKVHEYVDNFRSLHCLKCSNPQLFSGKKKDSVEWNNKHLLITPNMITTSPVWELEIQNVAAAENASCGSFVLQRQFANRHNCKCVRGLAKRGQQQKALRARCTLFALVLFVTQVLTLTVVFLWNEI